ncbi:unnamed protein product, partial [Ectocarpus sp. 13 AM-2016]
MTATWRIRTKRRSATRMQSVRCMKPPEDSVIFRQDDDPSVQNVRVTVRSQIASGLRGETDDVIKKMRERGDDLFKGRKSWLGPLWE